MTGWKKKVEGALRNLSKDRQAINGLEAEILEKQADMIHLTELGYGQPDDPEGAPSPRIRKLMDEKRVLEARKAAKVAHVEQVDSVLAALDKDSRDVLTECYCTPGDIVEAIIRLQRKLNTSESTVWRIKRQAMREFAQRMGWI